MKFQNLSVLLALILTSADAFSVSSSSRYTSVGGVAQFGASHTRNRVTALKESAKNDEKDITNPSSEKKEPDAVADEKLQSDIEQALKKAEKALNIVDVKDGVIETPVKEEAPKATFLEEVSKEVVSEAAKEKKVAVPPPPPPKPPVVKDEKSKQIESEALLAAVGGASVGLISGLAVTLALGDVYKDVDIEYVEVIPPAVLTVLLAGLTYAISTGGEGGVNGFVRKNLANIPRGAKNSVTSLVTGVTSKIVDSIKAIPTKINTFVQNKVEQTKEEVQAIPIKVQKSVETKIEEAKEEIERIPDKVKDSVERTAKATAEAIDDKINETVEDIKAAPGKIADGTAKFVEQKIDETEKAITKTVDDVVSAPKKLVEEITGTKQGKLPTPPKVPPPPEKLQASSTASPPKLPDSPPPKVDAPPKIPSFKAPEVPKIEMPKLELPKVELPKVDVPKVPQRQKPPPEQPKIEPPPPQAKKGLDISPPKLPSIKLPEIKPPKLELQNSDNFVFSEASLKNFIGDVVSEDKSELSSREAEAARKAGEKRVEDERRAEAQRVEAEQKAEEKRAAAEEKKQAQEQAKADQAAKRAEAAEAKRAAAAEAQTKREASAEAKRAAAAEVQRKREAAAEAKRAAAAEVQRKREAAAKASQAEETVKRASPGATISLFGFGQKSESATEAPTKPAPKAMPAPRGVPTISKWRKNRDSSISGFISGSDSFDDGDAITTSAIAKGEIASGNVVQTGSGSRYFLDTADSGSGSGFSFFGGGKQAITQPKVDTADKAKEARAAQTAKIAEAAEAKRAAAAKRAAEAQAKREAAAAEAQAKKEAAASEAERKREEAQAKREAAAAESQARKEAAAAEAQRKREEAQAKKEAAVKSSKAEQTVKAASPGATISLFGFGQKSESATAAPATPASKAKSAPRGVPTISKWRENRDGSISGFISGSAAFVDGDAITTSAIAKGEVVGGNVVQTGSGSRYYLDAAAVASSSSLGGGFSLFGRGKEKAEPTPAVSTANQAAEERAKKAAEAKRQAEEARAQRLAEARAKKEALAQAKVEKAAEAKNIAAEQKAAEAQTNKEAAAAQAQAKRETAAAEAQARKEAAAAEAQRKREEAQAKREAAAVEAQARKEAAAAEAQRKREEAQAKREAAAAEAQAKREAAVKASKAEQTVAAAKPSVTISLFGFGGQQDTKEEPVKKTTAKPAPRGVPILSRWRQNRDGSISGFISGSSAFDDGDAITTSAIAKGEVVGGNIVETGSGSRYYLDAAAEKSGSSLGGGFSLFGRKKEPKTVETKKAVAVDIRARKDAEAEAKRQTLAQTKVEQAAKRAEAAEAKRAAIAQRAAEAKAKREAAAAEAQAKKENAASAAQAKREALAAEAQEKKRTAVKASKAEQSVKAASPGATISLFGFGQKSAGATTTAAPSTPASKAKPAPRGVPTISKWRENRDGSISGFISGSAAFDDGDAITTSAIAKGEVVGGNVVQTGSGSRYYLDTAAVASSSSLGGGFSLFGRGKENSSPSVKVAPAKKKQIAPASKPSRSVPLKKAPTKAKITKRAPPGVPSMVNWRKNRNGSVTGFISGSPAFEEGERITTSPIAKGDISAGEVVQTGSGSRYFLV